LPLVLARRDQRDLPRLEDGRDPHRDRLARHVVFAEKVRRGVFAGERVERDQAVRDSDEEPGY